MARAESASGPTISTTAPRLRAAAASTPVARRHPAASPRSPSAGAVPIAAVGTRQSTRSPRPGAGEVEIGGAPDPAVDVFAPADLDGREVAGNSAGRRHRVAHARLRRAVGAEDHAPAGAAIHRHDVQPAVEPRAERVHARAQVAQLDPPGRHARRARPPEPVRRPAWPRSARARPAATWRRARAGWPVQRRPQHARAPLRLDLTVPADALLTTTRVLAAGEPRGDDRAGGGADQLTGPAEVLTGGPCAPPR